MKDRSKLSKLSRMELVELIYEIRRENVTLTKRCRRLEKQVLALQNAAAPADDLDVRLDGMEDMLRDIRRQLTGRRASLKSDPSEAEAEFFRGVGQRRE